MTLLLKVGDTMRSTCIIRLLPCSNGGLLSVSEDSWIPLVFVFEKNNSYVGRRVSSILTIPLSASVIMSTSCMYMFTIVSYCFINNFDYLNSIPVDEMYTVRFRFKKAIINCTQITLYGGDSSTCTINYASIEPHAPICLLFSFPCGLESRLTHTTHTLIVCVSVLQLILDFLDSHNIVMVRRVLNTNVSPEFVHVHICT